MLAKLPMDVATSFVLYLKQCADSVEKKADEYQEAAKRQYGVAYALRNATIRQARGFRAARRPLAKKKNT